MKASWLAGAIALVLVGCGGANAPRSDVPSTRHEHESFDLKAASALDADATVALPAMPAPPGRVGEWITLTHHNHSAHWDGKKPLTKMIAEAKAAGLDAMSLTDHNTMRGCDSPEFRSERELLMIKGMEWNAWREKGEDVVGHASLLGMKGSEALPTHSSLEQMLAEATARDATIVINHPFTRGNTWKQERPDPRAHAVEVWNGWWALANPIVYNNKALEWWHKELATGRKLSAVGGSDYHGNWYKRIDQPINLVFVKERTQEALLESLRKGSVSILATSKAPRVVLEADGDGDGTFETIQGEAIASAQTRRIRIRAHVLGGKGKTLVFHTRRGLLTSEKLSTEDAYVGLELVALAGQKDFVRAELKARPEKWWSMSALTNPIYLE